MTNCIICNNMIDSTESNIIICGNLECFECECKLNIGDNYIINFYKENPDVFNLLIKCGEYTMLNKDKYIPTPFSKSTDLTSLHSQISPLIEEIKKIKNDDEIIEKYGYDMFVFLKYTLKHNIFNIKKTQKFNTQSMNKDTIVYNISYLDEKNDTKKYYLYHGSINENWYSIMCNGLKNMSKTKFMRSGAAYGNGIYLSDDSLYSQNYCEYTNPIMGIFEVFDDINLYRKASCIYVITNDKLCRLKYLIVNGNIDFYKTMNNCLNKENKTTIYSSSSLVIKTTNKRLLSEMNKCIKLNEEQNDIEYIINETNVLTWKVNLRNFDSTTQLYKDMKTLKIGNIELEILFPEMYPMKPPFIRIVYPRFEFRTGHITLGGSICIELLTNNGWAPIYSIENLIIHIRSLIVEGEGTLDKKNYNKRYSLEEAKQAYTRMLLSHGWN